MLRYNVRSLNALNATVYRDAVYDLHTINKQ